ncbi:enoyl-CoA hydratase/carnithine racemase [Neolewinella xylanilytica]|uniref:Enoyl-CoA hydratase/carnithine racemase n=1 Tax=Neolewinella xylanilytica TaxID=1514080 RepID=A0A2S6IBL8_9BACT|nr:enoyl-CoA hydratase/isomerase family protein [Neolewinella xylanilytica]PPK88903.1 enoyl-CoA hydratase/carnithine racemase [Neolewinella xylanilytica]
MPDFSTLDLTIDDRLATVTLANGKVNAINTALAQDLRSVFLELDGNDTVDGVVLAGRPHCFCAGLDVMLLATSNQEELAEFFSAYLSALQTMVRFNKPMVAAITGYAPAGGTILALTADYRIMARGEKHTVGMNEFNMSLQIPRMMADIYAYYLGEARAWADIQGARMYTGDDAVRHGLVHETLEVDEVLPRATAYCRKLAGVHPPVFKRTKRYLRRGLLASVDYQIEEMVDVIAEDFSDPVFKHMMELFVSKLR